MAAPHVEFSFLPPELKTSVFRARVALQEDRWRARLSPLDNDLSERDKALHVDPLQ